MEKKIAEQIMERTGKKVTVEFRDVVKNNGNIKKAVVIHEDGQNVAPTIYYNPELSDDEIVEFATDTFVDELGDSPQIDMGSIMSKKYVLNNVVPILVNADRNDAYLKDAVHTYYLADLAIIYKVNVNLGRDGGNGTITIMNSHLDYIGVTAEELHEAAINNIQGKGTMDSMFNVISQMSGQCIEEVDEEPKMFVITNDSKVNGASAILDMDIVEKLQAFGDMYIIPSSVHEVIAVKADDDSDPKALVEMIRSVNDTQLDPVDLLSYNLFKFNGVGFEKVEVA